MELRPYQSEIIEAARHHFGAGKRTVLIQLPTGGGKTVLAAKMIGGAAERGNRTWFICHRREILKQASQTFRMAGIPHGIIAAGALMVPRHRVQVCAIDTLRHRVEKLPPPDLICWDEVQHLGARTWKELFAKFPNSKHVGLSATPIRMNGGGLGEFFEVMVQGPTTRFLINNHALSPFRLFAPSTPDLKGVHTVAAEYNAKELAAVMDKPTIIGDAVEQYLKHAKGKPFLAYCVSIEASEHAAAEFTKAGLRVVHVDGNTDPDIRDRHIAEYKQGKLDGITSVAIFTEGTDLPGVQCIIQLRPTQSLGLYLQMVGRGLRYQPGKTCIILDHAGNWERHGLPDDIREWSLEPGRKAKPKDEPPVRQCKSCFAVYPAAKHVCPECGWAPVVAPRMVEQQSGELVEVTEEAARQRRLLSEKQKEQAYAKSITDLVALGRQRGYARPEAWAQHIFNARQRRRA